jgi:hypothetical protein
VRGLYNELRERERDYIAGVAKLSRHRIHVGKFSVAREPKRDVDCMAPCSGFFLHTFAMSCSLAIVCCNASNGRMIDE